MRHTTIGKGIKREPKTAGSDEFQSHASHPFDQINLVGLVSRCWQRSHKRHYLNRARAGFLQEVVVNLIFIRYLED